MMGLALRELQSLLTVFFSQGGAARAHTHARMRAAMSAPLATSSSGRVTPCRVPLAPRAGARRRPTVAARATPPTPSNPPATPPAPPASLGDLLSPAFARSLQLSPDAVAAIMDLAGTTGPVALDERARALSAWKARLRVGALPDPGAPWPDAKLSGALVAALQTLDLPRFCRRHPGLLDALLMQVLGVVAEYEKRVAEAEAGLDEDAGPPPPPPPPPPERRPGEAGEADPDAPAGEGGTTASDAPPPNEDAAGGAAGEEEEDWEAAAAEAMQASAGGTGPPRPPRGQDTLQLALDSDEVTASPDPAAATPTDEAANRAAAADQIAADLAEQFEAEWRPVAESLGDAEAAFEDLSGLVDGPRGFDTAHALWRDDAGWREVASLSAKLEQLRELRDLVRSLGRAAGKGPLRRAPAQVDAPRRPPGMLRSPLQPEETAGLARSGDLSRMLPHEAHLVAAGWPRGRGSPGPDGVTLITGSRPARLLHLARRAERTLQSYDRTGWLEGEPARTTGRQEVRPAAELGPIIVCLDTSGSMVGARETVAKAVALECARSAHRSGRACFLYAFSGPGDVTELDIRLGDPDALARLLVFLRGSFGGGTDADAPLERSLARLESEDTEAGWARADILMVTDGEIGRPSEAVLARLDAAKADRGLEVHGLLVGRGGAEPTDAVRSMCTHIHTFRSWSAVGAGRGG